MQAEGCDNRFRTTIAADTAARPDYPVVSYFYSVGPGATPCPSKAAFVTGVAFPRSLGR